MGTNEIVDVMLGKIVVVKEMECGPLTAKSCIDIFPPGTIGRVIGYDGGTHLHIAANFVKGPGPFRSSHDEGMVHRDQLEFVSLPPVPDDVIEKLCGIITDLQFQLEQSKNRHREAMSAIEEKREEIYELKRLVSVASVHVAAGEFVYGGGNEETK